MGKRVVVLGAGVTGEAFVSALRRLDAEAEITVVEHELLGGECSYWACIPSKTLLRPLDVIAHPDMDEATRADMREWTGCIAGALTRDEFEQALAEAGLEQIEIDETHRVHEHASSAIIRARKP